MPAPAPAERQPLQEAAEWFVLLASGEASADERRRWRDWRNAHPSHEQAWQRAESSVARFAAIAPEQASASAHALAQTRGPASAGRRKGLAQLGVLLAAGLAGWQGYRASDRSADLLTAVGEQRDSVLPDGSRVVLDTDTALDIDFSATTRLLRLRHGQIMVSTAPDAAQRPFIVETADGHVRALGTRFTVRQEPASTRVAVLEARVALHGSDAAGDAPILGAGQGGRFDRRGLIDKRNAPASDAAWTRGMLIADDLRLADLVAELARYRSAPLDCAHAAADLRISGTFPLRDAERALAAVGDTLPIQVERRPGGADKASLHVRLK
ncbi:FecR domain-containing protein [Janthinobacterium sp. hw3]|uniref:FecR domain-containing protein n=1 Tax=Janthinobacterium fluminis TaxID=2987524 RepID=A0ABT5K8T6_9BURK|nr:FecR domain-containing protein [Janthinobacterium fluminis]